MFRHFHWRAAGALAGAVLALWLQASGVAAQPSPAIPAGEYVLDKLHSTIIFRVSHLGFSYYTASFTRFDANLEFDPRELSAASFSATIDITSLQLPPPPAGFLDKMLGPDWFDAKTYPQMHYQSVDITQTGANTVRVTGELTLKGETHPVVLDVTFNGGYAGLVGYDPQARVGFSARGTLSRSQFNMGYGLPPEGSNMGVGDSVEIIIETEFNGPPSEK